MTTTIPVPDVAAYEAAAPAIVQRARALTIASEDDATEAGRFLVSIATERKARVSAVAPAKTAAHAAHKAMTALEAKLVAPLDEADGILRPRIAAWERAKREQYDAAQRAAAEAARKEAEAKQIANAVEAEDFGLPEVADAILDEKPIPVSVPVAPPPKVEGVSTRKTYRAEVVDLAALVRHVAATPAHAALILPNEGALNTMARTLKEAFQIPGVRVVAEESVAVRTR